MCVGCFNGFVWKKLLNPSFIFQQKDKIAKIWFYFFCCCSFTIKSAALKNNYKKRTHTLNGCCIFGFGSFTFRMLLSRINMNILNEYVHCARCCCLSTQKCQRKNNIDTRTKIVSTLCTKRHIEKKKEMYMQKFKKQKCFEMYCVACLDRHTFTHTKTVQNVSSKNFFFFILNISTHGWQNTKACMHLTIRFFFVSSCNCICTARQSLFYFSVLFKKYIRHTYMWGNFLFMTPKKKLH